MKKQATLIFLALLMVGFLALPGKVSAQKSSTSISSHRGVNTFSTKRGSERIEVEYDGRIKFSDDDRSIESISNRGYIRIWIRDSDGSREVLAEAASGGTIDYEYHLGRRRADYDDEAKKWLADNLIKVIRATGIGAEARVERFYKNSGVDGVLNEIKELTGDYVSHIYFQELLYIDGIKDNELVKIAELVPKKLDSDYYISEVFKDGGDLFLKTPKVTEAFLSAMNRMDSDYYIAAILKEVLREDLSNVGIDKVLENLENMDSDYYKASIVKDVFDNDLSNVQLISVLESIEEIGSDYYKSDILKRACRLVSRSDEEVKSSFKKAARGIRSDYYYGTISRCID